MGVFNPRGTERGLMKLQWVHIKNYRSCRDILINMNNMHALVGANNAGKSSILRALDLLFNPKTTKIDEEAFWNRQTENTIWIEAVFGELTSTELADEKLQPYLRPDGTFHMARSVKMDNTEDVESGASDEMKVLISQHYCKPMPTQEWLQDSNISSKNITEWWKEKENLTVNGTRFEEFVGGAKPSVGDWKQKAKEFVEMHLTEDQLVPQWNDNPQGYAGVLKGTLPHYIFVPAVRDITDEAKVTKTNPFGQLLYKILNSVTLEQRTELETALSNLEKRLNRAGGNDRFESIVETEKRLNEILGDYMPCDLEIEFQSPTIERILTTPQLFAHDGFKNVVTNKGHGLQRAIIFSILRCYSEQITGKGGAKSKPMIFAVEEPELYMHPQAQRTVRRTFEDIATGGDQVIFSTHSALLLDVAYFDEVIRVEAIKETVEEQETVYSRIWQLPMQNMIDDLKARLPRLNPTENSMRELYSHAYHPNRSEGFFAKKIILVEGATEQYAIPIYAESYGKPLDLLNVSVVDCGGKGTMDRLYRIFNELGIPCFLLFDYDKDNEDSEITRKSREILTLIGADTSPTDDVKIEDNYAFFPNTWEDSINAEIANIDDLISEARTAMSLKSGSGKPLIARYIAKKLARGAPPFVPETVKTILDTAVNLNWTESCLSKPD